MKLVKFIVVIVLIGIALLPTIASTRWGTETFLAIANKKIPGTLAIKGMDLSWWGGQRLEGITLHDPDGSLIISCNELSTEASLLGLARGKVLTANSSIDTLNITLTEEGGQTNLEKALGQTLLNEPLPPETFPIILSDFSGEVSRVGAILTGKTEQGGISGSVSVQADDLSKVRIAIENFPAALLDVISPTDRFSALFGESFNLTAETQGGNVITFELTSKEMQLKEGKLELDNIPDPSFSFDDLNIIGRMTIGNLLYRGNNWKTIEANWKVDGRGNELEMAISQSLIDAKGILRNWHTAGKPDVANAIWELTLNRLTITPELFALFRKEASLELREPMTLKGTAHLHNLTPWWKAELHADLKADTLAVRNRKTKQEATLNALQGSVNSDDLSEHIMISCKSSDNIDIEATCNNLFKMGRLNTTGASLDLRALAHQVPTSLICELAFLEPAICRKLSALVGTAIDANISVNLKQMDGPIKATINGENGKATLEAQLFDGVATLTKPFTAVVQATPTLGKEVLRDIVPILSDIMRAKNPITFTIATEDFRFPVRDFSLQEMRIGNASVDFGKMYLSNQGEIATALGLLNIRPKEDILVWFTPLYFSLKNGTVKVERADMLLMDRFPVAVWGKVDLLQDKVDLILGITPRALQQAFNINVNGRKKLLQLPIQGSTRQAKINMAQATARIAAITAQQEGSVPGKIIGTLVDAASGGLKDGKTPPPTTEPLPWSITPDTQTEASPEEKTDTIKEIGQEAGNLIKKLFK